MTDYKKADSIIHERKVGEREVGQSQPGNLKSAM